MIIALEYYDANNNLLVTHLHEDGEHETLVSLAQRDFKNIDPNQISLSLLVDEEIEIEGISDDLQATVYENQGVLTLEVPAIQFIQSALTDSKELYADAKRIITGGVIQ